MERVEEKYMRRALELALNGRGLVSPNPMVGAVVECDGRITGEGWHRRFGGAHAEVNAIASVADKSGLGRSTMYVTLEPCSHYGKTPPCADMLVREGIGRVVVATLDPFEKVSGRGVGKLLDAGVEVVTGMLEEEARELNVKFFTAHTLKRPYVLLKWAESADGYLDGEGDSPVRFSNGAGMAAVHQLRSEFDAIMVGSGTVLRDHPRLDVRLVEGRNPRPVILDRRGRIPCGEPLLAREDAIKFGVESCGKGLEDVLGELYNEGITSVMVEGGATLLGEFLRSGLWDAARVEVAPFELGERGRGHVGLPVGSLQGVSEIGVNKVLFFRKGI